MKPECRPKLIEFDDTYFDHVEQSTFTSAVTPTTNGKQQFVERQVIELLGLN